MNAPVFESSVQVRSYELDAFGHVNHAVYLQYFEYARFQALSKGGFDVHELERRGEGIHVVRVEIDYRREARLGDELVVRTVARDLRNSSMTLEQRALADGDPESVVAEARVVVVWVGPDGRPMRIPEDIRRSIGGAPAAP